MNHFKESRQIRHLLKRRVLIISGASKQFESTSNSLIMHRTPKSSLSYRWITTSTQKCTTCTTSILSPLLPTTCTSDTTKKPFSTSKPTRTTKPTKLSNQKPYKILGLQQIAIGSTDKSSLTHLWQHIFGLPKIGTYRSESENVDEDILILGGTSSTSASTGGLLNSDDNACNNNNDGGGDGHEDGSSHGSSDGLDGGIEVDLMTPIDVNRSPKVHQPPLNHIGLWVDDLPAAVQSMKQQGVRFAPGGIRKGASGYDVTFIHPKGNDEYPIGGCGVLIELVQAPDSMLSGEGGGSR